MQVNETQLFKEIGFWLFILLSFFYLLLFHTSSDIGYGNYILTSPAAERKGRAKEENVTSIKDSIYDPKIGGNIKNLRLLKENRSSRLQNSGGQIFLGQKNFMDNQSTDLNLDILRSEEKKNTIRDDADKIDASELMSNINTLTNPYNKKTKIEL